MTVDTLSLAQQLRAAELPATQAEAIAAAIGRAVVEGTATKADLESAKLELKSDITVFKSELETKLEKLHRTLMAWFIGTNLTLAAIIVAAVKL